MKILLATAGSRGDVQPLIALASALKAAGHDVLLCAPPEHEDWIRSYGCSYRAAGSNVKEFLESHQDINSLKALRGLIGFLRNELKVQTAELHEIMGGYKADLVIGSSLMWSANTVAEAHHCPCCYIAFCPQILPSKYHPMIHIRNHNLPKWINRLSWWGFLHFDINFNYRTALNKERAQLGLPPISAVYRYLMKNPVIVASDEQLGSLPADVPSNVTQIGYCHLQQDGRLPTELQDFLASGSPPVFVGFGSMPTETPQEDTDLIMEAAKMAGERIVLSQGWAKLGQRDLGDSVFVVENVPHELLFPKMAAVVHHGGAGTTATAARAGVPQIIVPHLMDQFYWANQVGARTLGPQGIRRSHLTAAKLADAITECLSTAEYTHQARLCAQQLQQQDPLRRGVEVLEVLGCP